MPTSYTGSAVAVQTPPGVAPAIGGSVVLAIANDGDTLSSSSMLQQPFKETADWLDFLRSRLAIIRGTTEWNNTTTYYAGTTVLDASGDVHVYRATQTNSNQQPSTHPLAWERCDYSAAEIAAMGVVKVTGAHGVGVVCSHGATCSGATMLKFASDTFRMITFYVDNVPGDSYTDVDLNGCDEAFSSAIFSATCGPVWASASTPAVVGLGLNVGGDRNVIRVYYNRSLQIAGGGSFPVYCGVSVTAWGT